MSSFHFTFQKIEEQYRVALDQGYKVIRCVDYISEKNKNSEKIFVNRVDIDLSVKKSERIVDIFNGLGIKASFFVRLHALEYNPFSFENYRILKKIVNSGHEIGYHSEVIDQSVIWNEDAAKCLTRDIKILNTMLDIKVQGVASHGGMTGLNNLDFWKDKRPYDFGLEYEAYDLEPKFNLFQESFYVSDSEWTRWKCYNKGKLVEGDRRALAEHVADNHRILYGLIHPGTYFDSHFYE
ncbi:MAG: hypothetical protein GDA51_13730 [Ekhidna sp.]|nr:hypothetical protein [Ekhidna sp.]